MGSRFRQWAIGLVLMAIVAAVGVYVYNLGFAHGLAEGGRFAAAPAASGPLVVWWPRPWGFGFGLFPFFPLLFILFWFFIIRALFWRSAWAYRGGWGYRGCGPGGVPPAFEEWHRRAHAQQGPPTQTNV